MSAHVLGIGDGQVQITIGGTMKAHGDQIQVYDWGEARQIATKVSEQLDQLLGPGQVVSGSFKSGPCFIATAVYGDFDHPRVVTLWAFRDKTLAKSYAGLLFIRTYYRIGPIGASMVRRVRPLRWLVRLIIDIVVHLIGK